MMWAMFDTISSEIFGPVLPIVPVDDVNEAIRIIRGHPSPLVIYVFTECEATRNLCMYYPFTRQTKLVTGADFKVIHKTRSGQITFNDTFQQLSTHEIPFGGCGESGCMCCSHILHQGSSMTTFFLRNRWCIFWKIFLRYIHSPSWLC